MSNKINIFVILLVSTTFLSCNEKDYRRDEILTILSEDTTISVKISFPEKLKKKDKIIVWSVPPLNTDYFPDSISNNRDLWIGPVLRTALIDSGYVNIEYIERNDSVEYNNRKYRFSDIYSKAKDLENLLTYIRKHKLLKNKKIVLAGLSEGGDINAIVASTNRSNIFSMLQIACCVLPGKDAAIFQREQTGYRDFLFFSGGGDQARMDSSANKLSSLDSYHKADIEGVKQFFKENLEPLEEYVDQLNNIDSIYYHIDLYLRDRWEKENQETKNMYNSDFENYYKTFAIAFTPQQIALRKFDPEKYYHFIKNPVLAVHGTEDKRIDCFPNIERMEQLLNEGDNHKFEKIILEGYNHDLVKGSNGHFYVEIKGKIASFNSKPNLSIDESIIERIIEWIDKQEF